VARAAANARSSRNASSIATDLIRRAILAGRLAPGVRLKEEELARELGISRTPVREALLILQTEGLVDSSPNRGAVVREYESDDLDDLYQLRAVVEGFAARLAAQRLPQPKLVELHASCDRFAALREQGDLDGLVQENLRFHTMILEAAGSERLAEIVRKVTQLPLVYRSYGSYTPAQAAASEHVHRQLVTAFEARDAERAEHLMKEHVYSARDVLVAQLRRQEAK
jgi:DNA-binding GntR family transcriptional regulator